ncbi:transmembrane protease serine 9-like [Saccostrea echinata]|uniref:transmembrane protease serine 9-like n=1 Tax=Saccostrea echinata TaxID=191078 RepID=UPI002A7EB59A|nr:transmembrane protease serine 9-like [Saccostrea echinata]
MLECLIDNLGAVFGDQVFHQSVGIPKGNIFFTKPKIFPHFGKTIDGDRHRGHKVSPRGPPSWSNSHSPVHRPHQVHSNSWQQVTRTSKHTHTVTFASNTDVQPTKRPATTLRSHESTSFSEWRRSWEREHASVCGKQHFAPYGAQLRIMGGMSARKGSWPWMVSVYFIPFRQSVCGGVLIDNAWFLTAAHCFDPPLSAEKEFMIIRLGLHNVTSPMNRNSVEQQRKVQQIFKYPGYGTNFSFPFDNDIALVKLNYPVETTDYVSPLCLPNEVERNKTRCVVTGWGIKRTPNASNPNEPDPMAWPDNLQQATVPLIEYGECKAKEGYIGKLTPNMLCAGYREGHVDTCNGDSGGPLQCMREGVWHVTGITSWGGKTYRECAEADQPGVYTKVLSYREWILTTMYNNNGPFLTGHSYLAYPCCIMLFLAILAFVAFDPALGSLPNNTGCGVPHYKPNSPVKRVVGGEQVAPNSWPWMALLKFDGHLTCGGTVVRNDNNTLVIITSAACVDGTLADETRWQVRLGVFSRASAIFEPYYQEFRVKKIVQHPDYQPSTFSNDIALMFVDGVIQETEGVSPACVTREMYSPGENCVTLGWGVTSQGGETTDRLQQVFKPILGADTCLQQLSNLFNRVTMLCAGRDEGGAGACTRDTGGPLLCKRNDVWYLTGIVSWGFGCGTAGLPPVYTHVFEYVTSGWLKTEGDI